MAQEDTISHFSARLMCPEALEEGEHWAFVVLPKEASAILPRRGRVTVNAAINRYAFQVMLEPDGRKSHWLKVEDAVLTASGAAIGETVEFEIATIDQEPDPEVPEDLQEALLASPESLVIWESTTTIARLDWIHWVTSAKQAKTRTKRIQDACSMLASGKKRVCCFDTSGFYSKAFSAPKSLN